MSFERCIGIVLQHEGGYVDDPADPGGETKYGISKRAYPDLDIGSLTREQAKAIYRRDYWDRLTLDRMDTDPMLRGSVFDMAVNAGPARAVELLQRAANAFLISQVVEDGRMGPVTRGAVEAIPGDRLLKAYTGLRVGYYVGLARKRDQSKRFLGGWLARAYTWVLDPPALIVEDAA